MPPSTAGERASDLTKHAAPSEGDEDHEESSARRLSTERKIYAGFGLAIVCPGLVGSLSFWSELRFSNEEAWVEHTYRVINRLDGLLASVADAQTGARRYVTTGDSELLERYGVGVTASRALVAQLHALVADNPTQLQRLGSVEALQTARIADLDAAIELRRSQGSASPQPADPTQGRRLYDDFHRGIDEMKSAESSLLEERQRRSRQASAIAQTVILTTGLLAIIVASLALIAVRRDLVGRARAEEALRHAKADLERRVLDRTAELEFANDSLRQSDRRFRAFVNATSDVVYRMSPDWSEMRHLLGQDFIADTVVPSQGWLAKYIHPDDQEHVMNVVREAIRSKSTFALEHRVLREDGTLGWTFSRAIPLMEPTGEIAEWFGAASDVTKRKEAEAKLQAQLARLALLGQITRAIGEHHDLGSIYQVVTHAVEAQLPVDFACIALYDPAGHYLTVSCVGAKSQAFPMQSWAAEQLRIPVDHNGLGRCVGGALVHESDMSESSFEFPQQLVQAGYRAAVFAPLKVESQVFGVMMVARRTPSSFTSNDCEFLHQLSEHLALAVSQAQLLSSLQRAYEDLRQSQQAVMQQERLRVLGQMASGIAHDINNALSPPALYVQLLLGHEDNLRSEAREYLKIIERSLEDIAGTVARLRTFYRPRDYEANLASVDLNQLLQQVVTLTRARWSAMPQEHGVVIELEQELTPGVPAILGVEHDIRDALTNLVFNAVDAMPQGGILTLRSKVGLDTAGRPTAAARQLVTVEIGDTGIGMSEAVRNRCLEPFFTTKGERGTGLGLAMVYGMAQLHGADLDIVSEVGVGTTMRLVFPAVADLQGTQGGIALRAAPPSRLLVIDDDPVLLKSLCVLLEAEGHSVVTADGGQRGIDLFLAAKARGEPFAALISDLGMPNMDGRMVAMAVKAADPDTPLILLTGWGQSFGEAEPPAHVDRVLSKPPKLGDLRAALAELV